MALIDGLALLALRAVVDSAVRLGLFIAVGRGRPPEPKERVARWIVLIPSRGEGAGLEVTLRSIPAAQAGAEIRVNFIDKLLAAEAKNDSMLCVGLDPEPSRFRRMEGRQQPDLRLLRRHRGRDEGPGHRLQAADSPTSQPDLAAHVPVFELLAPGEIGVTLTESMEMVPEQTTSAIVVHHPQAKYFAV